MWDFALHQRVDVPLWATAAVLEGRNGFSIELIQVQLSFSFFHSFDEEGPII